MIDHQPGLASDEAVRVLIREHALSAAEGPLQAEIRWLYEALDRLNVEYLDGELKPITLTVTPPHSAKALADASEHSGWGGAQQLRVRPSVVEGLHPHGAYAKTAKPGWRMREGCRGTEGHKKWLSDLLLHEALHLLLNQRGDPRRNEHQGHGKVYTELCNQIGEKMGLPPVKSRRRKGDPRELPISAAWPFCVRPGGEHGDFYGDLWEKVAVEKEEPEEPASASEQMFAIWWHEDTSDAERTRFLRKLGLYRVGTAEITDETSPVTTDDDGVDRPGVTVNDDAGPIAGPPAPAKKVSKDPKARDRMRRMRARKKAEGGKKEEAKAKKALKRASKIAAKPEAEEAA